MKILILCAGRGTRLGVTTDFFPKAMVTINHKPVLGHILDHLYTGCSFETPLDICIAVGYKSEIIKSYVDGFYPHSQISFIDVDKFEGESSGPGYSLLKMKDFVGDEPFILILGDTLCFDDLADLVSDDNCICVHTIEDSSRFTTCHIDNDNNISAFYDKQVDAPSKSAIIGVYYIKDSQLYFEGLEKTKNLLIENELQISNGLNYLLEEGKVIKSIDAKWKDTGIEETLSSTRVALDDFSDSENNLEICIIQGDKIRTYYSGVNDNVYSSYYSKIVDITGTYLYNKVSKEHFNYPKYLDFDGLAEFQSVRALISPASDLSNSIVTLFKVLRELKDNLYSKNQIQCRSGDIQEEYINSIIDELSFDSILKEYFSEDKFTLNGVDMLSPEAVLADFDLELFLPEFFVPIHGNLSLDNIFYNLETENVRLVNPKMWFGNSFIYGDFAYDLASFMKSLGSQYNNIRLNNFRLEIDEDNNFMFEAEKDYFIDVLKEKYLGLVFHLFEDDELIRRVSLLESILFLKNAIRVNPPRQKLAYFFTGVILLNKVANCEFIAK